MDDQFRQGGPNQPQWGPPQGPPPQGPQQWGQQPQYGPPPGQPYGQQPYGDQPQYGPPPGEPYGQQPYPTQQFGGPPPDYLSQQPVPPRRSRGKVVVAAVATGAVVALTAGGVYAYTALSGGGAELASKVPGDAVAYAEVNLDPPAGQKVAAVRFLRHFPDLKVGNESGSLIESVVEPLISDPADRKLFADNIKPWVGKHVAIAGDPQGGKIQPVIIVESTDAGKAKSGLDTFNGQMDDRNKVRYFIDGDVVYLGEEQGVVDTASKDARAGNLASNDTFSGDIEEAGGDEGILTFWSDLGAVAKYEPGESGAAATAQGRIAGGLTFTDTTADLRVRAVGNPTKAGSEKVGPRLRTLPGDTFGAAAFSGGDELVRSAYDQLQKSGLDKILKDVEEDLGLDLPDDVAALVGTSTVIAIGGSSDEPGVGLVSKTDDPERARSAAEKIFKEADPDATVVAKSTGDGTVIASDSAYADKLTGTGNLGEQENFKAALPDLDSAQFVVWADVQKFAETTGEEIPAEAKAVRSFGLTATSSGDTSTLHARLVVG